MFNYLLRLNHPTKKIVLLLFDGVILPLGLWLAMSLRYGELYIPAAVNIWFLFALAPIAGCLVFMRFGLYRAIIRYLSYDALFSIALAVTTFILIWSFFLLFLDSGVPRSVPIIYWLVCLLFVGGSRLVARWVFTRYDSGQDLNSKRVLIYGAGSSGRQLAMSLNHGVEFKLLAYVDDDKALQGRLVRGKMVYSPQKIDSIINETGAQEILLAMPSINRVRKQQILFDLEPLPVKVREIPSIEKIASGELKVSDIRDIAIYDLLERNTVKPDVNLLHKNITDKAVMVTGAGGSIGSELCRQILSLSPTVLILFELNEYLLYSTDRELLKNNDNNIRVVPVLGNILDQQKLGFICEKYKVQTIYHAAAYKHVPMVEANPLAGLVNNVIGTLKTVVTAHKNKVETFVLISTDKAVRPTNVMGATKRFAEMILQAWADKNTDTIFTMVRFGNVLNSSGSVIPIFKEQIAYGGPVTVTHPDITRFFMMIPEAVELVIQAGAMAKGGEVFVLDMGQPIRIDKLARRMIQLSGLTIKDQANPGGDIEIKYTGLRDGEKLYEELLISNDDKTTAHPAIRCAHEHKISWQELEQYINAISDVGDSYEKITDLLSKVVHGYKPFIAKANP